MKEITHTGVIAIAIDYFVFKMVAVVLKLVFYIRQLGIEFIFLRFFRGMQVTICGIMLGHNEVGLGVQEVRFTPPKANLNI